MVKTNGAYRALKILLNDISGSDIKAAAVKLRVSRATIHNWLRSKKISMRGAVHIERVTNGKYSKKMLRPDITDWGRFDLD